MFEAKTVAVVVPAYREERLISRMLRRLPSFVDAVYVVDDASDDRTLEQAESLRDPRVRCVRHAQNLGVGAAIVSGYRRALDDGFQVLVVMAGDDQMDPADLPRLIAPVARGQADYVKGNRFLHALARRMPLHRRWGGQALSLLTRLTSGLEVDDCQCGFTVLSGRAARELPLGELWPRYGYPNDLLLMLAARGMRVAEVPVRPVYADEQSGVRPWHLLSVAGVIVRRALRDRVVHTPSLTRSLPQHEARGG
jgi:glycosyltransferase involved in cell wall biosynthesis